MKYDCCARPAYKFRGPRETLRPYNMIIIKYNLVRNCILVFNRGRYNKTVFINYRAVKRGTAPTTPLQIIKIHFIRTTPGAPGPGVRYGRFKFWTEINFPPVRWIFRSCCSCTRDGGNLIKK